MDTEQRKNYHRVHVWLLSRYGNATKCEMEGCKGIGKRMEWSLKKGFEYEKNIDNFWQLCASCHRKYDWTAEQSRKVSEALRKRVYTPELRRNMSLGQRGRVCTPEELEARSQAQKKRHERWRLEGRTLGLKTDARGRFMKRGS